jgi:acylphosphatase
VDARAHVLVSGVVQGVLFRATTRDRAQQLGVSGFVRNTPDGRVEAVFEGEKENVEKMVEFCKSGPPGARVDHAEVAWEDCRGEFEEFVVRY